MDAIKDLLKKVIKKLYSIEVEPEVSAAPENTGADFSSNVALKICKEVKKRPIEIATEIEKSIFEPRSSSPAVAGSSHFEPVVTGSGHGSKMLFSISVAAPGFLNFTMGDKYYLETLKKLTEDFSGFISQDEYSNQMVICEFSDPNPFKVLHAGHLYTSIVGDAISRLFENAGAKVVRANFGGDVGLHVAKTLYALRKKFTADDNFTMEDIAKNYVEGTAAYENDEEAKREINGLNKEIYKINSENIRGNELADLYWKGRELSYEYFKDFYARIGVKFDKFYPESTVAEIGLKKVKEELKRGIYEESNGAIVFRGEPYGLHTRVFINKDGVPTYETKDVGLIFQKWEDWHFDRSIVITGNEQLDYMKVVLKSIEQYAPELVSRTTHLTHGLVRLPGNVKMSSRLGNGLKAVEVLDLVAEELKKEYGSDNFIIVMGAIKYAFLKYKIGGNIVFDPTESVKMTGCSGPYLQYSCVRAKKIIEKVKESGLDNSRSRSLAPAVAGLALFEPLVSGSGQDLELSNSAFLNLFEKALIKKILEYKSVLKEATMEMAPHKVANYLYELAQEFSRFYENCPVIGDAREELRGAIVKIYLDTMTHGLNILGIEIPEEM